MEALSEDYQCVAIDTRGYNLSDKPKGDSGHFVQQDAADLVTRTIRMWLGR